MAKKKNDSAIEAEVMAVFSSKSLKDQRWQSMLAILVRIQECRKQHEDVRREMEGKMANISGRIGYLYEQLRKTHSETPDRP